MDKKQMDAGIALNKRIEKLEFELRKWQGFVKFRDDVDIMLIEGFQNYQKVDMEFIDVSVLKTLTIAKIEKELKEARLEFSKL